MLLYCRVFAGHFTVLLKREGRKMGQVAERAIAGLGCLKMGQTKTVVLDFTSVWCRQYFELSGDENRMIHSPEVGKGIVQGMGIMTKVGAAISRHMPGFMVVKVGELKFRKPVFVGNLLHMTMQRLDDDHRLTKVAVTLEKPGGDLVSKFELTLCPVKTE